MRILFLALSTKIINGKIVTNILVWNESQISMLATSLYTKICRDIMIESPI